MTDTHYVEPTGLSSRNQSSAKDLAALVKVAHEVPLLRELSTSKEYQVALGRRQLQYPQHQCPGQQPRLGHRPAEDRLHQ